MDIVGRKTFLDGREGLDELTAGLSAWAEIDLAAIRDNVRSLKRLAGPNRLVMACVKGDGYGHGMIETAKAALEGGADRLSVAQVREGTALRRAGMEAPILVLIQPRPEQAAEIAANDLTITLGSAELARRLAGTLTEPIKVHVEVDTGMGRVPLKPEDLLDFLNLLDSLGRFEVEGLYSHLSNSRQPDDPEHHRITLEQIAAFKTAAEACRRAGWSIPIRHLAATGGAVYYPESHLDMIRPGTLVYGFTVGRFDLDIRPAMSFKTRVWDVRPVKAGQGIGYGRAFRSETDTVAAILSAGYADGYPRLLGGVSEVLIRGQRARVKGVVGMDQMMADVGHIDGVEPGDEVVLIGRMGKESITAVELGGLMGTIPVPIVVGVSARVERFYLNTASQ